MDSYFAVSSPGLEPFTARELEALFPGSAPTPTPGGVEFRGGLPELYRANLHLRTASRVLARLGNFFYATTFPELKQRAAALPWERFLVPGEPVALRVTCHKSRLYHSDAVARTVLAAIEKRFGQPSPLLKPDEEADAPPQLVIIRLSEDRCTISLDSSGVLLHKRGYRQAVARAPLRKTLAAALLMASGWDKTSPLLDPFCGSGTISIEAALLALAIPPGLHRRFAFMEWHNFDAALWESLLARSTPAPRPALILLASDRDAGAVEMATANAARAGVSAHVEFTCRAVSAITPPPVPGWVVTNPPYGQRLSRGSDLRNLYAQFGNVLRRTCPAWHLSILFSDPLLLAQMQFDLDTSLSLVTGGIPVRLARGLVA